MITRKQLQNKIKKNRKKLQEIVKNKNCKPIYLWTIPNDNQKRASGLKNQIIFEEHLLEELYE